MDAKAIGTKIRSAREAKNLTQEDLAALVDISTTHISVIERGRKITRLDTFVAIANALDVSADYLLSDVVNCSTECDSNILSGKLAELPNDTRRRVMNALDAFMK